MILRISGPEQSRPPGQLSLVETAPEHARKGEPASISPTDRTRHADPARSLGRKVARLAFLFLTLICIAVAAIYWLRLPPRIEVVKPRHGGAVQAVYATGTVEPSVMVPIAARSAARLVELKVDEGSIVAKGQLLARLESDDLRRAVEVAEAEERYAKAQLERAAQLVEHQVTARSAYERAKADWEKAKASRERAAVEAGYLDLIAPADGMIIRRDGEIGQMIGANQSVFWMSCCAPLRISAEVDEEDIARIRSGQQVLIRSDAFAGKVFEGRVKAITPKGDPVARTYRVRVSLPPDAPLMIGMTAETNIVLRQSDHALLLPAGAVRQETVWRVEDGVLSPVDVTLGAKSATEVEVVSGVSDGDIIVAAPAAGLKAGQKVRPIMPAVTARQ
jgi:membrane fusion protein, multidrug efflux system